MNYFHNWGVKDEYFKRALKKQMDKLLFVWPLGRKQRLDCTLFV